MSDEEMKHTPGPWEIDRRASTHVVQAGTNRGIAPCGGYSDNQRDPEELASELEANAHLIAAAPELLEALERVIASHDAYDTMHAEDGDDVARMVEWAEAEKAARDAINKATGRQP